MSETPHRVGDRWWLGGPPQVSERTPTRWYSAPAHVVLGLVRPGAYGPRMAASSWRLTWLFFVGVWMVLLVGSLCLPIVGRNARNLRTWLTNDTRESLFEEAVYGPCAPESWSLSSRLTLSERLRMPLAALVTDTYWATDGGGRWSVQLLTVPLVPGGALLIALLLVPAVAAHLPAQARFGRTLKLTLWSSVICIPALAVAAGIGLLRREWMWLMDNPSLGGTYITLGAGTCILWLAMARRLAVRPATPEEAVELCFLTPLCARCDYSLTGLSTSGVCPECEWPVASSLQLGRRESPWAAARGWRRIGAWFATTFRALLDRRFFATLHCSHANDAAFGFLLTTAAVAASPLCVAMHFTLFNTATIDRETAAALFTYLIIAIWLVFVLVFGIHGFVALRHFRRRGDTHTLWTASCYGSALALPAIVLAYVLVVTFYAVGGSKLNLLILDYYSWLDLGIALSQGGGIAVLLLAAGLLLSIVLGFRRFLRGVTEARLGETLTARSRVSR